MDAERWAQIQRLFHAASELPRSDQDGFLTREAGDDPTLAADVRVLLEQDAKGDSLLHRSLRDVARDAIGSGRSGFPRELGPYRLHELLGEGGMGVVFRAERADVGLQVAIKFLRDAWLSPTRRALFAREQRALARLHHPNIARLYDADSLPDGTPWYAMEFVDGLPLTRACEARGSSVRERVTIFRAVCEAVLHAHQQALLHRDIKPSNILVTAGGQPRLLDFGIARPLDPSITHGDGSRTLLRAFTPAYAAPEQFRGDAVDVRSDLYSLGAVLFELLTGRPPLDIAGSSAAEAERMVLEQSPERPSEVLARDPSAVARARRHERGVAWSDLDVLCLKALQKDPARRYASVDALLRDLDHWLRGDPIDARPDTMFYRLSRFASRHRAAVAGSAAACLLLAALTGYYTVRLSRARDAALAETERVRRIQAFTHSLFEGGDAEAGPSETLRVVTLLERGIHEASALEHEPMIQADLFQTLGGIEHGLGRLERADTLQQRALALRRAARATDADMARSLIALSSLRVDQSRFSDADSLARRAVELTRARAGADPAAHARAVTALGDVLVNAGDYEEAIQVLEAAARLDSVAGSPARDVSRTLTLLANGHFYAGHYAIADSLNRVVLALDLAIHGPDHPRIAGDEIDLGAVRQELGDWPGALQHYRRALDIYRRWHGEEHFETAAALNMVGRALVQVGRRSEGRVFLERALQARERLYGAHHTTVASTLNELGVLAQYEGRWQDAEQALRRMREIYESIYGGKHYLIGLAIANLGSLHSAQGREDRAEPLFREALQRYAQVLAPSHPYIAATRIKLGRALLRQSRFAEAAVETRAGYEALASQPEPPLGFLQHARRDLERTYTALGRPAEAARFREEARAASADSAAGQ